MKKYICSCFHRKIEECLGCASLRRTHHLKNGRCRSERGENKLLDLSEKQEEETTK